VLKLKYMGISTCLYGCPEVALAEIGNIPEKEWNPF
jgi:hypothetical protein